MSTATPQDLLTGALLGGEAPATGDDPELDRLLDVAMDEITHYGLARKIGRAHV